METEDMRRGGGPTGRLRRQARRLRRRARLRLRGLRRAFDPVGRATLALTPMLLLGWLAVSSAADVRIEAARSLAEGPRVEGQRSLERYGQVRLEAAREWAEAYRIPLGLARSIQEAALVEGLEPLLAFRLVRVESSFRRRAVGPRGSVGYTQVRPSTARWLDPSVSRDGLFETETNLRLGFRYLSMLLRRYDDDIRLALLAYNRGPGTVATLLELGEDPANGYATRVLGRPPAAAPGAEVAPGSAPAVAVAGEDRETESPGGDAGSDVPAGAVEESR